MTSSIVDMATGPQRRGAADGVPALPREIADSLQVAVDTGAFVPSSPNTLAGKQWRVLSDRAGLSGDEMTALRDWIEEAYDLATAERFEKDVVPLTGPSPMPLPPAVSAAEQAAAAQAAAAAGAGGLAARFAGLGLAGGTPPPAPAASGDPSARHGHVTGSTGVSRQQSEDEAAHGMQGSLIAILTFVLHTARMPPPSHPALEYGVDPSAMDKLYKTYKNMVGTLLWDLVTKEASTLQDFQEHFHQAQEACNDMYPAISSRISSHWMKMQTYFGTVELIRAYYKKFLTVFRGRGLPSLVDEGVLMSVLCAEVAKSSRSKDEGFGDKMKEMSRSVERYEKKAETLNESVAELKSLVGNLKAEVKSLKEGKGGSQKCGFCGGWGHSEDSCRKKKDAAKEADK